MFSIEVCKVPENSFLASYAIGGNYTDSYCTSIAREVSLAEFINAFYTTHLFKLERTILKWGVSMPSTDLDARQLAVGVTDRFAAWTVEQRDTSELLMCDFRNRTRSWLKVEPGKGESEIGTQLLFGSAVVQPRAPLSRTSPLGPVFYSLIGFHKIYSRLLLQGARDNLKDL
ncbi:MAG: hypothetical protein ACI9BW_002558 [Gammaproteobacteria bacterium]|jgi:hypothetical protein